MCNHLVAYHGAPDRGRLGGRWGRIPRMKGRFLGVAVMGAALSCSSSGRIAPEARPPAPASSGTPAPAPDERALQRAVDEILSENALPVAAVILSTETGRPLALGRHRGADPATLAVRPGSTVKSLLAWIAAEQGVLEPKQTYSCDGQYPGGFYCYAAHGVLTLPHALETSCNVYAFELSSRLGLARIADGFRLFGFGKPTALVATESAGFVADPAWVSVHRPGAEGPAALAVGGGHGAIVVTPLQLAVAYGKLVGLLAAPNPRVSVELQGQITEGLRLAVEGENGTARSAAVDGLHISGKTGTAEGGAVGAEPERDNAWFVGFAPREAPRFVVSVLVVGGESGPKAAAPVAARLFERLMR